MTFTVVDYVSSLGKLTNRFIQWRLSRPLAKLQIQFKDLILRKYGLVSVASSKRFSLLIRHVY